MNPKPGNGKRETGSDPRVRGSVLFSFSVYHFTSCMTRRVVVVVCDGLGVGAAPDAAGEQTPARRGELARHGGV